MRRAFFAEKIVKMLEILVFNAVCGAYTTFFKDKTTCEHPTWPNSGAIPPNSYSTQTGDVTGRLFIS